MVLLLDYPSLFSFSLWVVCSSVSLHARCTFTVQQTMLRCSRQLCCLCLCKHSDPQTWLSDFGDRSLGLPCAVRFLSTLFFHCCRFKIPPSPICLFLKSPFLLCDILFHASVRVFLCGLTYLILRSCV